MATTDPFGIPIKYRRLSGGQQYYLSDGIVGRKGNLNEYDGGRVIVEEGGDIQHSDRADFFVTEKKDKVRISFTTTEGYQSSRIVTNRESLLDKTFMQSVKDFGNFELTFSFIYNGSGNEDCYVFLSGRGGKHRDDRPCEGCSYEARLFLRTPNVTQLIKEAYKGFMPTGSKRNGLNTVFPNSNINGREIFLKLCVYDLDENNLPTLDKSEVAAVRVELYAGVESSEGSGVFTKLKLLQSIIDSGNWSTGADHCGAKSKSQILLWDAPLVSIGWSGFPDFDFRKASIVEIDPTTILESPPEIGNEIPPQENPTPPPSTTDPNAPESINDSLGVKKIYKTEKDGTVFEPSSTGLLSDNRYSSNGAKVVNKGNGRYHVDPGTTRICFYSTSEAKSRGDEFENYETYNFEELRKRKSWDDPKTDFHNTEYTVYIEHIRQADPGNDEFSLVVRSVRHEQTSHSGCGGSSYHGNVSLDGFPRYKKEQLHVDYDIKPFATKGIGSIRKKVIGMKFICYDVMDGKAVKNELWFDKDNNNKWELMHELLDQDDWGDNMTACGALKKGASILWGSPKAILKTNHQEFFFSKVSIRNIKPERVTETPSTGGDGGGSTGNLSRVSTEYIFMWDAITDTSGHTCEGGSGPAPPPATFTEKYGVNDVTDWKQISGNYAAEDYRKRVMEMVKNSSSKLYHIIPTKLGLFLRKHGSPTGTGYFEVYDNNRPTPNIKAAFGTIDVSTLGTSGAEIFKTKSDMSDDVPNGLGVGWGVGFRYEGGDSSNYVEIGVNYDAPFDSSNTMETQYERENGASSYSVVEHSDRDIAGHIYKSP